MAIVVEDHAAFGCGSSGGGGCTYRRLREGLDTGELVIPRVVGRIRVHSSPFDPMVRQAKTIFHAQDGTTVRVDCRKFSSDAVKYDLKTCVLLDRASH